MSRGPWRFYCERCHDTGWAPVAPSAEEQARLVRFYGDTPAHADYVVRCDPCRWLQMEREKRRKQQGQDADADLVTATQVRRRK